MCQSTGMLDVQGVEHREGRACRKHGHDGNDQVYTAVGEDHDYIASLDAALHKVVREDGNSLEDVLVCECALGRSACSCLNDASSLGVLARVGSEYLMDGTLEVRPTKVCRGVRNVGLGL
jgi:hypothetical protein